MSEYVKGLPDATVEFSGTFNIDDIEFLAVEDGRRMVVWSDKPMALPLRLIHRLAARFGKPYPQVVVFSGVVRDPELSHTEETYTATFTVDSYDIPPHA